MRTTIQYTDTTDRERIIESNNDKYLVEDHVMTDGNFLVFEHEQPLDYKIKNLEAVVINNNLTTLDIQLALYEEILMLRDEVAELKNA